MSWFLSASKGVAPFAATWRKREIVLKRNSDGLKRTYEGHKSAQLPDANKVFRFDSSLDLPGEFSE